MPQTPLRLNLGCGATVHKDWVNMDMVGQKAGVVVHNFLQGLPFESASVDVVYHSHVLEHFAPQKGMDFLKECCRVLRPDGVIRIVVPDLEEITKHYLDALCNASKGDAEAQVWRDWYTLELLDQAVRERGGGEMLAFLENVPASIRPVIFRRVGMEVASMVNAVGKGPILAADIACKEFIVRYLSRCIWQLIKHPFCLREVLIKRLLGVEYELLELGRFRRSGEIHHHMYDCYSLRNALEKAGFVELRKVAHDESTIMDWSLFLLDSAEGGSPRKPGSLYMEGRKPAG